MAQMSNGSRCIETPSKLVFRANFFFSFQRSALKRANGRSASRDSDAGDAERPTGHSNAERWNEFGCG